VLKTTKTCKILSKFRKHHRCKNVRRKLQSQSESIPKNINFRSLSRNAPTKQST